MQSSGSSEIKVTCVSKLVNKSRPCYACVMVSGMPVLSSFDVVSWRSPHSARNSRPEEEHLANRVLEATAIKTKKTRRYEAQIELIH